MFLIVVQRRQSFFYLKSQRFHGKFNHSLCICIDRLLLSSWFFALVNVLAPTHIVRQLETNFQHNSLVIMHSSWNLIRSYYLFYIILFYFKHIYSHALFVWMQNGKDIFFGMHLNSPIKWDSTYCGNKDSGLAYMHCTYTLPHLRMANGLD